MPVPALRRRSAKIAGSRNDRGAAEACRTARENRSRFQCLPTSNSPVNVSCRASPARSRTSTGIAMRSRVASPLGAGCWTLPAAKATAARCWPRWRRGRSASTSRGRRRARARALRRSCQPALRARLGGSAAAAGWLASTCVVSFETIEHLPRADQPLMIAEIRPRARAGRYAAPVGAQSRRVLGGARLPQSVSPARADARGDRRAARRAPSPRGAGIDSGATSGPRCGARTPALTCSKHWPATRRAWMRPRHRRAMYYVVVAASDAAALPPPAPGAVALLAIAAKPNCASRRAGRRGHAPRRAGWANAKRELDRQTGHIRASRGPGRCASASSSSGTRNSSPSMPRVSRRSRSVTRSARRTPRRSPAMPRCRNAMPRCRSAPPPSRRSHRASRRWPR